MVKSLLKNKLVHYIPIEIAPATDVKLAGIDGRILSLLEIQQGEPRYLQIIKEEDSLQVVYLDAVTGFEYVFESFTGEWADVEQMKRFGKLLIAFEHDNSRDREAIKYVENS